MHRFIGSLTVMAAFAVTALAQAPRERGKDAPPSKDGGQPSLVTRMMAFDKDNTGKLTKEMITDPRLHRLFDQADANKDGIVTKEELMALAAKLQAEQGDRPAGPGARGPGGDRPAGPGARGPGGDRPGPGGDGPGGPGRGPGGGGPMARGPGGGPGMVLGPFFQNMLKLTEEQKKQVADLQKEVDDKLAKILTDEQKKQLAEMRQRGPGAFGPPDGKRPGPGPGAQPDGKRPGPGGQPGDQRNPPPKKDE